MFHQLTKESFAKRQSSYEYFGVQKLSESPKHVYRYIFRVTSPNASQVALIGDFNSWSDSFMYKLPNSDIWELVYESDITIEGMKYKYRSFTDEGIVYIIDQYAREFDIYPEHISIVKCDNSFEWHDDTYIKSRKDLFNRDGKHLYPHPMNVYSVALENFVEFNNYTEKNYRDLTSKISDYIIDNGYTHISLSSVLKNGNADISFAPNPAYGSAEDFKYLVDILHSLNIGILLTLTQGILDESCLFWVTEFHIDGFFLTSGTDHIKNIINNNFDSHFYDIILIYDTPQVTKKTYGNLLLQDSGWTKDIVDVLGTDPYFRAGKYNNFIFPLVYAFSDNFILTSYKIKDNTKFSSLFSNMFGDEAAKLTNMRMFFTAMITHPGKKHISADRLFPIQSNDGTALFEDPNKIIDFYQFIAELNRLYLKSPALWDNDFSHDGFEWVCRDRGGDAIIAYKRISQDRKELITIFNLSSSFKKKYRIDISGNYVYYREIFNTDAKKFGGENRINEHTISRLDGSVEVDLPPNSAIIIEPIYIN